MTDVQDRGGETPPAATMVLKVGYRGGAFSGFAEQQGQRSVAGELRHALETYLRRPIQLVCAGRTDAGVHALAQYVSLPVMEAELSLAGPSILRALTALAPHDISVRGVYRASPSFSARFDARSRGYRYRIVCGPVRPVHGWGFVWWLRSVDDLDLAVMQDAARCLLGEHDFVSFCKTSSAAKLMADGRSTCRNVTHVAVGATAELGEDVVVIDICANAFLHNMVRAVVGSLVEVGRGLHDAAWLGQALAARNRRAAGPTAPACGLTLERVTYEEGALVPW